MVLLDFFRRFGQKKYQLEFVVAHLDHGLRPDSAATADWLKSFCQAQELTFVSQRLDIAAQHQLSEQSSLEAVARELRYAWLTETALADNCSLTVTAHTASDQAETILMRLIRGGISGLGGMSPRRPLNSSLDLIRPFLTVSRPELEAYAQAHQLQWREDASNQDSGFFRNRVRAELLPWILRENPRFAEHLNSQSEIWRAEQDWLQRQIPALYQQLVVLTDVGQQVETAGLLELHPALQRLLIREVLTRYLGQWKLYTHVQIEAIRELAAGPGAKSLDLPAGLKVSKQKKQLLFAAQNRS